MEREARRIWIIAALLIAGLVALRFAPEMRRAVLPRPVAAHVVLLAEGARVARAGEHRLAAGTPFRLFAAVEAETLTGARIVYTEAPRLELGGAEVPAERLARWPADRPARVRWLTVEGFAPYLAVAAEADLGRFRLLESFHPEWGSGWSVPGVVDPRNVQLDAASPLRPLPFGTQRFALRFELLASEQAVTPETRVESGSAADGLDAEVEPGTRVAAELPGALARLSRAFGLTQIDLAPDASPDLEARVAAWHERGLAFERTRLLAEHLAAAGLEPRRLVWKSVDLAAGGPTWDGELRPGDLLQGGERIVALFRDAGEPGRLDPADLCFDFERGAKIRRLDQVYRDEGGFELEWASLAAAAASGAPAP